MEGEKEEVEGRLREGGEREKEQEGRMLWGNKKRGEKDGKRRRKWRKGK